MQVTTHTFTYTQNPHCEGEPARPGTSSELSQVTNRVKDKEAEGRSDSQALNFPTTTGNSHILS